MGDYVLRIVVETLKRGSGAQQSQREIDQLGQKLGGLATAADRAGIRTAALDRKQQELARAVAKGSISVEKAAEKFAKFRESLPVDEMETAKQKTGSFIDRLKGSGLGAVTAFTAGLAGMAVTAKKAFDLGQYGAGLTQLRESFDRVNKSVFQYEDLLKDMQSASRDTISEIDIMRGVMTLTAGAGDDLAKKLAEASPKLLEIAKAANKVNPLLGDTAFLYESIALGVKRGSPLILDNLGIMVKVGEANRTYAESLGKTTSELTVQERQMALLNETIRAGEQLISQAGGNVDAQGDAYAQASLKVQEMRDRTAELAHQLVGPLVKGFVGVTAEAKAAEMSIDDWIDEKDSRSIDEYIEKLSELKATFIDLGGIKPTLSFVAAEGNVVKIETVIKTLSNALFDMGVSAGASRDEVVYNLRRLGVEADATGGKIAGVPFSIVQLQNALKGLELERLQRGMEQADQVMLRYGQHTKEVEEETVRLGYGLQTLEGSMLGVGLATAEYMVAQEDFDKALSRADIMLANYIEHQSSLNNWLFDNRDAIDDYKRQLLSISDIAFPEFEGPSVAGRAAFEIFVEHRQADQEIENINTELDKLPERFVTNYEIKAADAQAEADKIQRGLEEQDHAVQVRVETPQEELDNFTSSLDALNSPEGAEAWQAQIDSTAPTVLNEEIDPLTAALEGIIEGNPYPLKLDTNTVSELQMLETFSRKLQAIDNDRYTIYVDTVYTSPSGGSQLPPPPGGEKRATGGDIVPYRLYEVGERGPEYFMSDVAGQITKTAPTAALQGGQAAAGRDAQGNLTSDNRRLHIENLIVQVPGINVSPNDAAGHIANALADKWS